jgi:hypothetical protein
VSNSEDRNESLGGVGAFTFDSNGNLIKYEMLLTNTTANCGGGVTPWETWISCEETKGGVNWQVDPQGVRPPQVITLGNDGGGMFESFAYDLVAGEGPQFFVTEDEENGPLRRWRPIRADWSDPWSILTGNGTTDYLLLDPANGTFTWTDDKSAAQSVALKHFPHSEGIDAANGILFFVTKEHKKMYILNLRTRRYASQPINVSDLNGQPDQVVRVYRDDYDLLFFTEDGGDRPGIYARRSGRNPAEVLTILESSVYVNADQETTGLAFSPDRRRMYFAIQDAGLVYEVKRIDGLPFDGRSLNVQYNNVNERSRRRLLYRERGMRRNLRAIHGPP